MGQYAQVLQFGQPIGVVQLTPHGWAGPRHLLHELAQPGPQIAAQGRAPGSFCAPYGAPGKPKPRVSFARGQQQTPQLRVAGGGGVVVSGGKRQKVGGEDVAARGWRSEDIEIDEGECEWPASEAEASKAELTTEEDGTECGCGRESIELLGGGKELDRASEGGSDRVEAESTREDSAQKAGEASPLQGQPMPRYLEVKHLHQHMFGGSMTHPSGAYC